MISIKDTLEEIILNHSFLEEALYYNYLNLSSFAEYIKVKIEKDTKKEVSIWAIKMALSRISKKKMKTNLKYFRFDFDDIFVKKDISIINIEKNKENTLVLDNIHHITINETNEYLSITQWLKEINIVYSERLEESIISWIKSGSIRLHLKDLSIIGLNLTEQMINEVWLFYEVSKRFAFYDINIIDVISTYTELCLIVKKEDVKKGLEILI